MRTFALDRESGEGSSVLARVGRLVRSALPSSLGKRLHFVESDDASVRRQRETNVRSDEDRVLGLLETRGGRIKQATIATATGWSDAKVSRLLSGMEEAGVIDRYRVGREKVVTFPDRSR